MLIVLYGPDTWRSREKLSRLKAKYLAEVPHAAYNLVSLNAKTARPEEISQALATPALLARRRMVVIEYVAAIQHKKILGMLRTLVGKSKEGDIVILWDEALPEKTDPILKALTTTEYAQEFKLLTPQALDAWISAWCAERGLTISAPANTLLQELVGPDLWRMAGELEKLTAWVQAD